MSAFTSNRLRRRGFTLVELLVVVGIIAILISILLPSLKRAKDAANATKCMVNQKMILTGLMMYHADYKGTNPLPMIWGQRYTPGMTGDMTALMYYESDLGSGIMRFDMGVLLPYINPGTGKKG